MRLVMMLVVLAVTVALGEVSQPADARGLKAGALGSSVTYALDQPEGTLDVDIDVNRGGGGRWYENPVWLAIGGLAVVLVLALLVMAVRGGGTTVVKG